MTKNQQITLAVHVAATMKALAGLVGVTDAKVASLCVEAAAKALMELDKFVESCKSKTATP